MFAFFGKSHCNAARLVFYQTELLVDTKEEWMSFGLILADKISTSLWFKFLVN